MSTFWAVAVPLLILAAFALTAVLYERFIGGGW